MVSIFPGTPAASQYLSHLHTGSDKHQIEVPGPGSTVEQLKELLCKATEIPPNSQKIIFKGIPHRHSYKYVSDTYHSW